MVTPRNFLTPVVAALLIGLAAGPAGANPGPPVTDDPPADTWGATLASIDDDDVNVAWSGALRIADPARVPDGQRAPVVSGLLVLAPHALATPANVVRAFTTTATTGVDVEYRGESAEQIWSEWT